MRLKTTISKNAESFYMIKSVRENGVSTSKIVEKLGTRAELEKKLGTRDPVEWANEYIARKTEEERLGKTEVIAKFSNSTMIPRGEQRSYNGGYLFLQDIYNSLGLGGICKEIMLDNKCEYDLNAILSRLIYTRILYPSSKLSSYEASKEFIEPSGFELHQIYRALDVIAEKKDFIQAELYQNSLKVVNRNDRVLFYDCTNYFFEIEEEKGDRRYGHGKEHRPNPIVQMGLFMDGSGIPLAFDITPGNTNEQTTLKPLEKKILSDFHLSKFIVCTDAGLSSKANRRFNDLGDRAYITTQSIKKLKAFLKKWALDKKGWRICGSDNKRLFNLDQVEQLIAGLGDDPKKKAKYLDMTFYKRRAIKENGIEENLIVTFSFKYQAYQRKIREGQIARAQKAIDNGSVRLKKKNPNDPKRFISKTSISTGEIDEKYIYSIDQDQINEEKQYDGYYGVCTNLDDDANDIAAINRRRWEIEECFRIMKSEFRARPVHLQKDNRILAHFLTCFIALMIYRLLERKLGDGFTVSQIISTLKNMNFHHLQGEGYIPNYTRTNLTDKLHETFGFRTDTQIVDLKIIKKIIRLTKH